MAKDAVHRPIARIEPNELDAALHGHAAVGQVFHQDPLGLGLGDEQDERIARIDRTEPAQCRRGGPPGVEVKHQSSAGVSASEERIREPETVEDLESPGLDRERARFVSPIRRAIDDPKRRPESAELGREGQAR